MRAAAILILLLSCLGCIPQAFSQAEIDTEEVSLETHDGSVFKGKLISENNSETSLKILTGDTITFDNYSILSKSESRDIMVYPFQRFHYVNGWHLNYALTIGGNDVGNHSASDISINKRINKRLTLGVGIGSKSNFTSVVLPGGDIPVETVFNHVSTTFFGQGRYYFTEGKRRWYVHARMSYLRGRDFGWDVIQSGDGFAVEYGIGMVRASKSRWRLFGEITQSHSYGTGSWVNPSISGQVSGDYNIWFNRISITAGVEYNLQGKHKKKKYQSKFRL